MVLNGEEKYAHKEWEIRTRTLEDGESKGIDLNAHLGNRLDKATDKLDRIGGAINLYETGRRKEGVTLDTIRNVMKGY